MERPRCQACGKAYQVEEHHIKFRSQFGKSRMDEQESPENKIYLCGGLDGCHTRLHNKQLFVLREQSGHIYFVSRSNLEKLQNWQKTLDEHNKPIIGEVSS